MSTIPRHVPAAGSAQWRGAVPRRVMQTFEGCDVPAGMWRAAASWRERNPQYEYRFFDDAARRQYLAEHFDRDVQRCYEALPAGAFRADLWRYCALLVDGGVYADLDTVCRRPLGRLLAEDDEFVVAHGKSRRMLFNAFVCCRPGHPFIRATIDRAVALVLAPDFPERLAAEPSFPFHVTGPGGLAAAVNIVLGRPIDTEFRVGRHDVAGVRFRILRKLHYRPLALRRVMDGLHTVLLCKYPGYDADLAAAKVVHWAKARSSVGRVQPLAE